MNLVIALLASEDPNVTHHWLLPETGEIIYGGLASLAIFYALYKFGWPAAKKGLEARTAKIQKELDDSATARREAEADAANIRKALGDTARSPRYVETISKRGYRLVVPVMTESRRATAPEILPEAKEAAIPPSRPLRAPPPTSLLVGLTPHGAWSPASTTWATTVLRRSSSRAFVMPCPRHHGA